MVAEAEETVGEEGGYRFCLPSTERSLELAFELIRAERACYPFLRFELRCAFS